MTTQFSSPVPVGSRYTSKFSPARKLWGIIRAHAGADWAPPKPGQNVPIFAVADGVVTAVGVGVLAGHSGQIIVIDHGTLRDASGADHTETNYGHLHKTYVRKGQQVKAGDKIGLMGMTGNVTGVHLHLGVRFNGKYADPAAWLKKKGVTPGVTKPFELAIIKPVANVKPVVKPAVNKASYSAATLNIQNALKTMGYDIATDGIMGPRTIGVIEEYQRSQQAPYKLFVDGKWGAKTKAHYIWTKNLQKVMNKWKGSKLTPDGHYGANTVARVRYIQTKNAGKAYKGKVDGIPGRVFCAMLKIDGHP